MTTLKYLKKDLGPRGRAVLVRELTPDKDCDTHVRKTYVYLVRRADSVPDQVPAPQICVMKRKDNAARREGFSFRVKGVVYFRKGRFIYRVEYLHGLSIRMFWKMPVPSASPVALA